MPNTTEIIEMLRVLDSTCKPESIEWVAKIAADKIEELRITTSAQKETIEELRARNSAQADMLDGEWISVEERLPDEWREVLTYSPIHSDEKNPHMIQLCWYIGNGKWRECQYGEIMEIPITHWMPVPAPPKEAQDA